MTWPMVYSTFIVSFSGGKPTKKLSNIWSVWATFILVQLSAPCDQLDHELISIYLIDYNHMKTFDNAGNIAPNHVSIWIWYYTVLLQCNVTLYLTVLCRAAPALNQNLRSRAGGALTPIFRLRAALQVHIWHSECPSALNLYMVLRACPAFNPYLAFRAPPPLSSYILCWKRAHI